MNKLLVVALCFCLPGISYATLNNCQNLYVGRIAVKKGVGLDKVAFLANPDDKYGAYWVSFDGWTDSEKKYALSILSAAKAAGHRVNVYTEAADGCSITSTYQVARELHHAYTHDNHTF